MISPRSSSDIPRVRHRRRQGFTLTELLAVIVIIGVLVGVSMPAFRDIITRSRVNEASAMIARDLEMGFSLATKQRRPMRLSCGAAGYTVTDRADSTLRYMVRDVAGDRDFNLTTSLCSASVIDFYPNGIASGALTIAVASGSHSRTITMSRAGQVRVTRP
jgi:prepilin-type N-terminal cleavage/methylation domain-containing protein